MRRTIATVLVALMLLLAGCASGVDSGTNGETTDGSGDSTGTVNMYVSDEVNAIDQFEHLNVTITKVGFAQADAEAEGNTEAESDAEGENETEVENETELEANATVNGSVEANTTDMNVTASADGEVDADASASESESESDGDGNGEWTEYDVDSKTVDLTELQGANATGIGSMDVEEGNYTKVFVYVSEVNGTLKTGETVNVKLPSNKLQLNKGFTIGANESVDFVYDITVVTAGNSGKYILKPVVSESGTSDEVDIEVVDEKGDKKGKQSENAKEGGDGDGAAEDATNGLNASFVGDVTAGSNATVSVTQNGSAVANATVSVDGEAVGTTNEDGELTFSVPEGSEEVEVTVTADDAEVELSQEVTAAAEAGANADNDSENGANALAPLLG